MNVMYPLLRFKFLGTILRVNKLDEEWRIEGVKGRVRRVAGAYREMLEEPCFHDVGGHFGKDAPLFLLPLVLVILVVEHRVFRVRHVLR